MSALPRWDVTDVYPSVTSQARRDDHEAVAADLTRLTALLDHHGIGATDPRPAAAADAATLDEVLDAANDLLERLQRLTSYVHAYVATDSRDAEAQGAASALRQLAASWRAQSARLAAWVAALGPDDLADLGSRAADHRFPLRQLAARADHQMPDDQEALYAELAVTGSGAWNRLHSDVTSQLTATVTADGDSRTLPMASVRGLAADPDPRVREAAFQAEQATWPTVAVPLAAAMNAIKGEAIAVNRRRRWADPLDASLFANAVDRTTYDAMTAAVERLLPDLRRYLRAKARLHGHAGALPWFDLLAPLPVAGTASYDWHRGTAVVRDAFHGFDRTLGTLLERAERERWIDAEPRDGKQGGAFCAPVSGDRSLVFLNWTGGADSVRTLAHELGHAYHNVQLADRRPLQRQLPMALAETASIFCETVVAQALLAGTTGTDRLALLDVDLQTTVQVVVDIRSRVLFEAEVYRRRAAGTLSPDALCELMVEAQRESYGDGLDPATVHPYMWAVKPHYYGSSFYNWPYTFGLLFGLGLYAQYERDPQRFRAGYDDLLASVGLDDAVGLGRRFALEVRSDDFWDASTAVVRDRIREYEALATDHVG